jgi:hypothetical protein
VEPLLALPRLARLESVDFSGNGSIGEQVDDLLHGKDALAHLKELDLRRCSMPDADVDVLKAAFPFARLDHQANGLMPIGDVVGMQVVYDRSSDDERYDSFTE